ncbi:MAG: response regulator, partial [Haliea sp.]|nr:response regulator [Haliea sp.]
MSDNSTDSDALWSHPLRGAITDVRALAAVTGEPLPAAAAEDLQRVFKLAVTLDQQLAANSSRHDIMNTLAAIRGYTEMLLEDIGHSQPKLNDSLIALLQAIAKADAATEPAVESLDTGTSTGTSDNTNSALAAEPGFILAVDDLAENRELVARYLSRSGHLVVTAASGAEALRTLADTDVDVVLLDLMMPDMDGIEVCTRLQAD